jgi:hypothetical protein
VTANATSIRLRHPATAITSATAASTRANEARASQARRLGYVFVQYRSPSGRLPAGPWLMDRLGRLVRPLLFTQSG